MQLPSLVMQHMWLQNSPIDLILNLKQLVLHARYIPEASFPDPYFPPYCSGSAFLLTPKVANLSLEAFFKDDSYFWIDDAFLTGDLNNLNIRVAVM